MPLGSSSAAPVINPAPNLFHHDGLPALDMTRSLCPDSARLRSDRSSPGAREWKVRIGPAWQVHLVRNRRQPGLPQWSSTAATLPPQHFADVIERTPVALG